MSSCASERWQWQFFPNSCAKYGVWYVQERFEDPEVVYVERDLPANGAHAGADAKAEAAPSGLDDGVPDYKGSAAKVLLAENFPGNNMLGCKAGVWEDLKTMCWFMCISKHRGVGFGPNYIRTGVSK